MNNNILVYHGCIVVPSYQVWVGLPWFHCGTELPSMGWFTMVALWYRATKYGLVSSTGSNVVKLLRLAIIVTALTIKDKRAIQLHHDHSTKANYGIYG